MVTINWTDQAIADLTNIAEFIKKDSEKYARITIKNIRVRVRQLKQFPTSGKIVPEIERPEIRELILGNYRIIYRYFLPVKCQSAYVLQALKSFLPLVKTRLPLNTLLSLISARRVSPEKKQPLYRRAYP